MFQRSYHLNFDGSPRTVSCIKENKYYTGRTGMSIGTVNTHSIIISRTLRKIKKSDKKVLRVYKR
jgi:hypothetical protein